MKVRNFQDADASAVARIMFDSFKSFLGDRMEDQPRPAEFWKEVGRHKKSEDSESVSFVAEDDSGRVVGFLAVSGGLKYGLGTLHQIGVDPSTYARGIGTALFQAAEAFWLERKMRKIYTCTSSINLRAQAYYKKMGFVQEGILKDHFFEGVDELQLAKFYR